MIRLQRQRTVWTTIAVGVAVAAAVTGLTLGQRARQPDNTSLQQQVLAIAAKLRVPSEHDTMTAANSPEPLAQHMRYQIQEDLLSGQTEAVILQEMQKQYGQDVLAAPADRGVGKFVWWLPLAALVILLFSTMAYLRKGKSSKQVDLKQPTSIAARDSEDVRAEVSSRLQDFL